MTTTYEFPNSVPDDKSATSDDSEVRQLRQSLLQCREDLSHEREASAHLRQLVTRNETILQQILSESSEKSEKDLFSLTLERDKLVEEKTALEERVTLSDSKIHELQVCVYTYAYT